MDEILARALEIIEKRDELKPFPAWSSEVEKIKHTISFSWELPITLCQAVGGKKEDSLPGVMATVCSQICLLLIDDLLDNDTRGVWVEYGVGPAANLALALSNLANIFLIESIGDPQKLRAAILYTQKMLLNTAHGQSLDFDNLIDEEVYWKTASLKSSSYFSYTFTIGALLGGIEIEKLKDIEEIGDTYGIMMQIHDDIKDVMEKPANPDWTNGRYPLPILYASTVNHKEKDEFLSLRKYIQEEPENEVELNKAQAILVSSGAVSYAMAEILRLNEIANKKIIEVNVKYPEKIKELFDYIVLPITSIMEKM